MTCRAWLHGSAVVGALLPGLLASCSTERLMPPARTATEQLLMSSVTWDSSDLMARGTRPNPVPWE